MKFLGFFGKVICCLAVCASLAGADSLQLRNGRHLQGKYIGGTSTAIGFMSGASVEYFATTDVLALMFENSNESPLDGAQQPRPMNAHPSARKSEIHRTSGSNSSPQATTPRKSAWKERVGRTETVRVSDDDQSASERLLDNEWLSSL
jgi:hypothetical protein